jgi:hypothetical protein
MEVIDLCSSSEEEEGPASKKQKTGFNGGFGL